MVKIWNWIRGRSRVITQVCFTALTNGYGKGFLEGSIYKGLGKQFCVPGLSCYSCPGALGACPIGALQSVIGSRGFLFSFYVVGFLTAVGAVMGRFVCGWLCPFGLVQDLLHRIPLPGPWKRAALPGDRALRWLKYLILVVFVFVLPMTILDIVGQGSPWFCKYLCPSGTLMAGIPLLAANETLRTAAGWLFLWKFALLASLLLLSLAVYRPFCRYLCPLGAIYGLFNPVSLYRYRVEKEKCTGCHQCTKACKLNIQVTKTPNSIECIRCGACVKACPEGALRTGLLDK